MAATVERVVRLSDTHSRRLERLAASQGTTEDALLATALALLFDMSEQEEEGTERTAWGAMSLNAFGRVWDNDADTVYDNWKELYGIPER